jgi:hypothetical protein
MAISESQLDTWSAQGSVQQSKNTYNSVKNALEDVDSPYFEKSFEVFLQGSYGNDTNVYAESDVDTVIRLDSIWRSDLSALPPEQQEAYHAVYPNATYRFSEFKNGVASQLADSFGQSEVSPGDRAFHIKPNGGRRTADVVACFQYRRYIRFISEDDYKYFPGIIIPSTSEGDIINYSKLHSEALTNKHQDTNRWFKPTVRIFKNMRNKLVEDSVIAEEIACSYYIEGLLYNVPSEKFGTDWGTTFCNNLNWLRQANRSQFMCPHGQHLLLGSSNVQWLPGNCTSFLDELVRLWNNWVRN